MIVDRLDEEFLLFSIHPDGTWVARSHGSVKFGLAGAWILELIRDGKVRNVEEKLLPKGKTPMEDETIGPLLERIQSSKRSRHVVDWLRVFSVQAPDSVPLVLRRLRGRGYVDVVKERGKERYPLHRPEARAEIRAHLRAIVLDGADRDVPSLDLLCLLGASGMTEEVFGADRRREAEARIQQIIQFDPLLVHVWRAIRAVRSWGSLARSPKYEVPSVHFRRSAKTARSRRAIDRFAAPKRAG